MFVLFSSVYNYWFPSIQFILQFHVSIITSESCVECLMKTLQSIQTHSIPFYIPLQDGSSIIILIGNPFVNIIDVGKGDTTTEGNLLGFIFFE